MAASPVDSSDVPEEFKRITASASKESLARILQFTRAYAGTLVMTTQAIADAVHLVDGDELKSFIEVEHIVSERLQSQFSSDQMVAIFADSRFCSADRTQRDMEIELFDRIAKYVWPIPEPGKPPA